MISAALGALCVLCVYARLLTQRSRRAAERRGENLPLGLFQVIAGFA
jgi:hypothetical protein